MKNSVRMIGLEPTRLAAPDPKSGAATNYATPAYLILLVMSFDWAKIHFFSLSTNYLQQKVQMISINFASGSSKHRPITHIFNMLLLSYRKHAPKR